MNHSPGGISALEATSDLGALEIVDGAFEGPVLVQGRINFNPIRPFHNV